MVAAPSVEIANRKIGPGQPCFIIAEAGVNHNGELSLAKRLIDVAVEAKADAVKFQTFQAAHLASTTAPKASYQLRAANGNESQRAMLKRLELSPRAHRQLADCCRRRGILFLSTPFDQTSADLLEGLAVPAFKIASGELTNLPLLSYVARKGTPLLVSTGMATLEEVREAVETIRALNHAGLVLLHCVSAYPAPAADMNLRAMQTLRETFRVPVGLSDHTLGIEVALAAVALGACVIEKHITLSRTLEGPDQRASLEPHEWIALVKGIRIVEAALGDGRKQPAPSERNVAEVARRSLVANRLIPAGTRLTEACIAIKRPGTGLAPALRSQLVGTLAKRDIAEGTLLTWEMLLDRRRTTGR